MNIYKPVIFLALAFLASACASQPTGAQVVPIELAEFAIHSPITAFKVGTPYRFVIKNVGAVDHEFVLTTQGEQHHMDEMGDASGEDSMNGGLHVSQDQLTPGATITVEFTFDQVGDFQFGCYIPGHYEAGMFTQISVVE